MSGCYQLMQDAAFAGRMVCIAAAAQGAQLLFQCTHAFQSGVYPRQLRVYQVIDVITICFRVSNKIQQALNVRQRHVQCPAVTNEGQSFQVRMGVIAVAIGMPGGLGQ